MLHLFPQEILDSPAWLDAADRLLTITGGASWIKSMEIHNIIGFEITPSYLRKDWLLGSRMLYTRNKSMETHNIIGFKIFEKGSIAIPVLPALENEWIWIVRRRMLNTIIRNLCFFHREIWCCHCDWLLECLQNDPLPNLGEKCTLQPRQRWRNGSLLLDWLALQQDSMML